MIRRIRPFHGNGGYSGTEVVTSRTNALFRPDARRLFLAFATLTAIFPHLAVPLRKARESLGRDINPSIYTPAEFAKKRAARDARSLKDVGVPGLSADARFVMAYDAARTLSLMMVRAAGFRPRSVGGHYNTFLALEAADVAQDTGSPRAWQSASCGRWRLCCAMLGRIAQRYAR